MHLIWLPRGKELGFLYKECYSYIKMLCLFSSHKRNTVNSKQVKSKNKQKNYTKAHQSKTTENKNKE